MQIQSAAPSGPASIAAARVRQLRPRRTGGDLGVLGRSWLRSLSARNLSARTIETYREALQSLERLLAAENRSQEVTANTRECLQTTSPASLRSVASFKRTQSASRMFDGPIGKCARCRRGSLTHSYALSTKQRGPRYRLSLHHRDAKDAAVLITPARTISKSGR
jgi:hypothetical protein